MGCSNKTLERAICTARSTKPDGNALQVYIKFIVGFGRSGFAMYVNICHLSFGTPFSMPVDRTTPVELDNRLQQWTMNVISSTQWTLAVPEASEVDWLASDIEGYLHAGRQPVDSGVLIPVESMKRQEAQDDLKNNAKQPALFRRVIDAVRIPGVFGGRCGWRGGQRENG